MRDKILLWMHLHEWHLKHPRVTTFWEWVVMPKDSGGRLGFKNWIRYVLEQDDE